MTEELAIHFAFGIACGLQSLHNKEIIHGDLAPRNILLNGEELIPKICDFGFSRKKMIILSQKHQIKIQFQ